MAYDAQNLLYDNIPYISSYCSCHNQKVKLCFESSLYIDRANAMNKNINRFIFFLDFIDFIEEKTTF